MHVMIYKQYAILKLKTFKYIPDVIKNIIYFEFPGDSPVCMYDHLISCILESLNQSEIVFFTTGNGRAVKMGYEMKGHGHAKL